MTEIVVAINAQDCTGDDGNTAEEFEAIAATLLRAAEVLRNQGKLECFGHYSKAALGDPPAIARFDSMREPNQLMRESSLSMLISF